MHITIIWCFTISYFKPKYIEPNIILAYNLLIFIPILSILSYFKKLNTPYIFFMLSYLYVSSVGYLILQTQLIFYFFCQTKSKLIIIKFNYITKNNILRIIKDFKLLIILLQKRALIALILVFNSAINVAVIISIVPIIALIKCY
jgi:hypothetical protein